MLYLFLHSVLFSLELILALFSYYFTFWQTQLQTLSQWCKSLIMFKHILCSIDLIFSRNNILSSLICLSQSFLPSALGTQLLFLEFLSPSFWGFPSPFPCIESLASWIFCFPKVSEKGWVGDNFLNLNI